MCCHDFRVVKGPTHTNLIFDAVVPYEIRLSEEEIKKQIEDMVKKLEGKYYAVVEIDRSYT